jgi:hypothetical protein
LLKVTLSLAIGRWVGGSRGTAKDLASTIVDALGSPASARVIGAAYLARHPAERDRSRLLKELDLGAAGCDGARIRALVADRRREDFASGRCVEVNGWILSRTEVRLCALAAL